MITFAGIDITPTRVPDDIQVILDQWWHGHRIEEFERTGHYTSLIDHLPIDRPPRDDPPRIGVLSWPSGASRWATCHLMVDDGRLDQIRAALGSPATAASLVLNDGTIEVAADMWMVGVRPVGQRAAGSDLYLVTLVDERFWWWHSGDEQAPASPASWTSLLTDLFASVGVVSPAIDAVHADYGTPDAEAWSVGYRPIPLIIDAAAMTVGMRVVRQLSGSVEVQNYATAAAEDEAQWTAIREEVLTGGRIEVADIVRSMPATLTVVFEDGAIDETLTGLALAEFSGLAGVASRAGRIRGDGAADAAFATQAATDWYKWGLSRTDCTLRGLVARPITGLDDRLEWVHLPGDSGIVTRVIRPPWGERNTWSGVLVPTDDDGGGGGGGPCEGHGWIIDADAINDAGTANNPERVLSILVNAGVGRCGCIERQPPDLTGRLTAVFRATDNKYHVLELIETCCSCGRMTIEFTGDDGRTPADYIPVEGVLELIAACDEGTTTYYFRKQCATETEFELAGHGPMLCTDTPNPIPCDNTFRVDVECADCTLENVECPLCCGCEAAPFITFELSGFSGANAYLNGFWALPFTEDCTWGLDCGGVTMAYGFAIDGADIVITFTISGVATYELTLPNVNTLLCGSNRTLSRTSGDSETTPASVTAVPFSCEPISASCYGDGGEPEQLWAVFHDCTGDFACLNGTIIPLTGPTGDVCGTSTVGYSGSVANCMDEGETYVALCCDEDCQWTLIFDSPPCDIFAPAGLVDAVSCTPFQLEWQFANLCAFGQAFITITDADPT